jgi:1-acyl-sn-glycerol-3-phosphate acyltransferase
MYNKILRPLYILIFEKLLGRKIQGHKPEIKKFVVIVAPHTSNWDFMVGEWARSSLRMKGWYIGKKEIFVWPFGYLFRALGGFPVDRNKSTNLVDQIVAIFNSRDEFNITIAPEGTRAYNPNWKTGFLQHRTKGRNSYLNGGFRLLQTIGCYQRTFLSNRKPNKRSNNYQRFFQTIQG